MGARRRELKRSRAAKSKNARPKNASDSKILHRSGIAVAAGLAWIDPDKLVPISPKPFAPRAAIVVVNEAVSN